LDLTFPQAYFIAAFGANLIQTIFASMQLNPVMNIMCLPFALVASVIAATTVFRHLYTVHDGLASAGIPSSSGSGVTPPATRHGLAMLGGRSRAHSSGGIQLGELRSRANEQPTISVHKMVEVEQETDSAARVGSQFTWRHPISANNRAPVVCSWRCRISYLRGGRETSSGRRSLKVNTPLLFWFLVALNVIARLSSLGTLSQIKYG
jgi:hypothetical protein